MRPGGTLAIVGFTRAQWRDWPWAVAAFISLGVAIRLHGKWDIPRRRSGRPGISTPKPSVRLPREILPGARIRHLLMGRYLLTWVRPPIL